ncbi:hypothetical protein D3C71_1650000 [compost metagenome]
MDGYVIGALPDFAVFGVRVCLMPGMDNDGAKALQVRKFGEGGHLHDILHAIGTGATLCLGFSGFRHPSPTAVQAIDLPAKGRTTAR